MNRSESAGWRRIPIEVAAIAVVVTGIGGALAGASIADNDSRPTVQRAAVSASQAERTSTGLQAADHAGLGAIVAKMPSGWPATEVMREAAGQPLRNAAAHHDWRQAAELMPPGWPATDVMRRSAASEGAPSI